MSQVHDPACTCRAHPWPASMRVRDARDAYLAENGFTLGSYDEPTTEGSILGVKFRVPNPPAHQRGIRLHDLHHLATGFGTDHGGEAELSAWQVRRGLTGAGAYVSAIVLLNILLGLALAPRRTFAELRSLGGRGSLYSMGVDYDALLERTVGELREALGIPQEGLAQRPRGLHAHAPVGRQGG